MDDAAKKLFRINDKLVLKVGWRYKNLEVEISEKLAF